MSGISCSIASEDPDELLRRRSEIEHRLGELGSRSVEEKTMTWRVAETHWDVVLKEVVWLSNDFSKERQRHISTAKKFTKGVDQFHKTKETKRARKIKEDQLALKRTASRIAKEASKFWLKVNKIIAFKQKAQADEARQKVLTNYTICPLNSSFVGDGQAFDVSGKTDGKIYASDS